jgi:hypothetical protein
MKKTTNSTTTVVLSDGLMREARRAAAESRRSLTRQIEFWASLGRDVEPTLSASTVRKLMRLHPMPTDTAGRPRRPRVKK